MAIATAPGRTFDEREAVEVRRGRALWTVIKRKPHLDVPIKLALFVGVCVAVFLLAKLSFRFFEAPILRLKKRFD